MPAGNTTTTLRPTLIVEPFDYFLVDIATGRFLPGDGVHAEQLAHEHGLSVEDAHEVIETAWRLGFVTRQGMATGGILIYTPEASQVHLHRLARALVSAVSCGPRGAGTIGLIDGEQTRFGAVELFGLTTPCDVELFLELCRALLGTWAPHLLEELAVPVAVLFSESAQSVHGIEFAAPPVVRRELVCSMVRSLIDGRPDDFAAHVADYVVAMAVA